MVRPVIITCAAALGLLPTLASAQEGISLRQAVAASILSDMAQDRAAERAASRTPYASQDRGSISSPEQARKACATEIVTEVGGAARIIGTPSVSSMSTGWEVEGTVGPDANGVSAPFVCSVRNGLVSGTLVRR